MSRDAIGWRFRLEPRERQILVDELASELVDSFRGAPADVVLDRVSRVLAEYEELSAVPDRIRPGDVITLRDFGTGGAA
ncbi:hypothetical protein [Streptomyces lasiicapitis]|uniref:hypothetical protein n=1 Tax=Streptomyces lasiicapitis TaxID=1923961 RepID=UPI00369AED39